LIIIRGTYADVPLVESHGPQPAPDPNSEIREQLLKILNPEIGDSTLQIFIEVLGNLSGGRAIPSIEFTDFILELGPCLVTHTYLFPQNFESAKERPSSLAPPF